MRINFLKSLAAILLLTGCFSIDANAQGGVTVDGRVNTVFTAIPFMRINPDARSGGMGDVGLATSPDAASLYFNGAKLAFIDKNAGVGITYTPWLSNLVDDIFIGHVSGFKRLDDVATIGASLRYFSLGQIQFTDINAQSAGSANPNEFIFDAGYARRLSDRLSLGLTLKYAYSNLASGQVVDGRQIRAANTVAADISTYWENDILVGDRYGKIAIGAAITNIGNKVSYSDDSDVRDFIPTNLGVGATYTVDIDDFNQINVSVDVNKLLVPTPDPEDSLGTYRDKALLSGMFGSFGDAPGGGSEELQELMYSVGVEYWYNNQFAIRAGHFNEHRLKGNRKYVNLGLGLKYNVFGLNFSYLISTSSTPNNPLENTLRFSLTFDFDGES